MMEIIKPGTNFDFAGKLKLFTIISGILMVLCLAVIAIKGFNFGIDFAGGTVIQVKFNNEVSLDEVRSELSNAFDGEFLLQNFGEPNEVLIRIVDHKGVGLQELSANIKNKLDVSFKGQNPEIQRIEQVGPQVGGELKKKAFFALLFSSVGVLIYLALRFEWVFAVGAIISLIHDTVFIMGVYSLSGKEFNLTVMAAVLTAAGYSLNDTIVIFDRIREKLRSGALANSSWKDVINMSINETLSRTVLTSLLTLFAVLSLFLFGGAAINGFALVMMVGIIVGTYSSIGVATMFIYMMRDKKPAMVIPVKQNA